MGSKHAGTQSTTFGDALWLAGHDIRASWLSYPATFLVAGFFGLLGTVQFGNALSGDAGAFETGLLDFYLMCLVPALATNLIFNRDYYAASRMESFDQRLSFLRSMPVSGRSAVVARTICAFVALGFAAPPFFLASYLIVGGLRESVGIGGYVCFCCFWIGYALATTGFLYIYGSFAVRWDYGSLPLLVAAFLGVSILVPVAFRVISGDGITTTVIRLAGSHGPVVAGVSLLVGAVVVIFSMRKAESGLVRRDIG